MKDLVELPKTAKSELKIIPVKHMDDVLADCAFEGSDPVDRTAEGRRSRK